MARHFRGTGLILRFIEFMDVGTTNGWRMDDVVPAAEIVRSACTRPSPSSPLAAQLPRRGRRALALPDGGGEIGVIASVTRRSAATAPARASRPRARSTPASSRTKGTDLRALLRGGATDAELARPIRAAWRARDDRYSELRTAATAGIAKIEMSYIGG